MTENLGPQNITKRLKELHKWQEEQQRMIHNRQIEQRIKLGKEQKELYSQLGIYPLEEDLNNNDKNKEIGSILEDIPKRKFLKRGEGLKNRFKFDPDTFRLHNLPKYKYSNVYKKTASKSKSVLQQKCKIASIDNVNNRNKPFEKDKTKNVDYLSTKEDLKEEDDSYCESFSANQEFKYVDLSTMKENKNALPKERVSINSNENPISWSKALNTYQIQPFPIESLRENLELSVSKTERSLEDLDNESIFELLEKRAQQGSFEINASLIQKWIEEKTNALLVASNEIAEEKQIKQMEKTKISPLPCDINSKVIPIESSESSNNTSLSETSEKNKSSGEESPIRFQFEKENENCNRGHVRFCEEVQVNRTNSDEEFSPNKIQYNWKEMDNKNYTESIDHSGFEKFKANLFSSATQNNEETYRDDTTLIEQLLTIPIKNEKHRKEIVEKIELLKSRIIELENEISTFRQNNSELLKLKQEHELNKIQLEHERIEMQEQFNDEKVKYEIHLHDERLKIEEEKKKLEKKIREQKNPNRKERDEILKLKDEIEVLQSECKNKESKHVAAQSRLRAQIRNLEKEVKDLTFEIDNLKKENKKLESENARMTRQNNNKMLQEINKSIAKLNVKPVEIPVAAEIIHNKNIKPVIAKVVSYKRKSLQSNQNSKLSSFKNSSHNRSCQSSTESSEEENYSSSDEENVHLYKSNSYKTTKSLNKSHQKSKKLSNNSKLIKNVSNSNINTNEFKREIEHSDGSKDIWYPNGNLKKISPDGMNIKMLYFNKDIKETNISEGTVRYYYAEKNTWHTTYLDGLEILEFPNGQTEHRHKDGKIEVHFPNGSIRISNPSDQHKLEEWRYADGTTCTQLKTGDKILTFPNGQKEIHTKIHKRREYPDGTVKIVYPDGSQETRYSNGRIRLKDKEGNLIMDSENNKF